MMPAAVSSLAESSAQETEEQGEGEGGEEEEDIQAQNMDEAPLGPSLPKPDKESDTETIPDDSSPELSRIAAGIPAAFWFAAGGIVIFAVLAAAGIVLRIHSRRKEDEARLMRRQRRLERLEQSGISSEQFESLVKQWRSGSGKRHNSHSPNRNDTDEYF